MSLPQKQWKTPENNRQIHQRYHRHQQRSKRQQIHRRPRVFQIPRNINAVDVTTCNGGNDGQRQNTSTPTPSPQPGRLRLRDQDNNTSSLRLSSVSSTDMTQDTYSDVLQKPGEWQWINRRKT